MGGYYDAGDHVKFGLPMAFTVTVLAWGVIEYGEEIAAAGEYWHALEAIKWGTDYFVKAHTGPNELWAEVRSAKALNTNKFLRLFSHSHLVSRLGTEIRTIIAGRGQRT